MIYAQFFTESTGYVPGTIPPQFDDARRTLIEATGDRAVIIIDGRLNSENIGAIAARECKARGFNAWQIFKGECFSRARPISGIWPVYRGHDDKTAMSATHGA